MSRSRILTSLAAASLSIALFGACSAESLTERAVGFGLEQAIEGDQDINLDFSDEGGGFSISTDEGDFAINFDEDSGGIVFNTDEGDGVIAFDEENGAIRFETDEGDGQINFDDEGAFTIDTESGFTDAVFVTASYGLGETVVQGAVNPDEFYVYKPGLAAKRPAILRRGLGSKQLRMVYADDPAERVRTEPVPAALSQRFCISDNALQTELEQRIQDDLRRRLLRIVKRGPILGVGTEQQLISPHVLLAVENRLSADKHVRHARLSHYQMICDPERVSTPGGTS